MAKPEWGVKRICPNCGTRFYDLTADPVICPACDSSFPLEKFSERKSMNLTREKAVEPKAAPAETNAEVEDDDDLLDESEDDVAVDDSVLLDDEEDDGAEISDIGDVAAEKPDEET